MDGYDLIVRNYVYSDKLPKGMSIREKSNRSFSGEVDPLKVRPYLNRVGINSFEEIPDIRDLLGESPDAIPRADRPGLGCLMNWDDLD